MTEASQSKFGALSAVLAKDLKDIEDLPNFIAPPPGVYKLMITTCGQKEINEKTAIVVEYLFLEVKSLNQPDDEDKEFVSKIQWKKDKMSEAFYFDDPERIETTISVLKKKYGPFGEALGTTDLLTILDKLPGLTVEAHLGRRADKNDKTKLYPYTSVMVLSA